MQSSSIYGRFIEFRAFAPRDWPEHEARRWLILKLGASPHYARPHLQPERFSFEQYWGDTMREHIADDFLRGRQRPVNEAFVIVKAGQDEMRDI